MITYCATVTLFNRLFNSFLNCKFWQTYFAVCLATLNNVGKQSNHAAEKAIIVCVELSTPQMTHLGLMHADAVHFHLSCCVKQVEISFSRHLTTTAHCCVSVHCAAAVTDEFSFTLVQRFTECVIISENSTLQQYQCHTLQWQYHLQQYDNLPSSISWYWPKGGDARWLGR